MNWWEWLVTGVFGGVGSAITIAASVLVYSFKNAETVMPWIMRNVQQAMHAKARKRASANNASR